MKTLKTAFASLLLGLGVCVFIAACDNVENNTDNNISHDENKVINKLDEKEIMATDNSLLNKTPAKWYRSETVVPSDEKQLDELLAAMSVEDKVGQLVMGEIRWLTPADVKKYRLGGVLNGGGAFPNNNEQATIQEWVDLADEFYQASIDRDDGSPKIPILWGTDAVHGHSNVFGATIFPHNIGLGATRNPSLMEKIGYATAKEVSATGIYWTFAPTVAVPQDERWGRTYEGYSEDPKLVAELSAAMVRGYQGELDGSFLQGDHVIATAKHFIGDGGTFGGVDQGDARISEQELIDTHAQGYFSTMDEGVQTVMASFNSWNGKKIHGDSYLLTDVLKEQMGFDGLVVGDWNGHGQIKGCTNGNCPDAINAGVDMIMVPEDWEEYYKNTLAQVKEGIITEERLNDAVRRILRVKQRLGMFTDGGPKNRPSAGKQEVVGHPEHRAIARQAVRESLVLLKNNDKTLPLDPKSNILVAGNAAGLMSYQLGGWSLTWQGTETQNSDFPGSTLILDGIQTAIESANGRFEYSKNGEYTEKPDAAIVIFSEPPYAEGPGDRDHLVFSAQQTEHLALMRRLQADDIPVVAVFLSGRAMWVNPEINASDAFVAAWLPGTEGGGVADVLFCSEDNYADCGFKGKLAYSWPMTASQIPINYKDEDYLPLFPLGYGLTYADNHPDLELLSEDVDIQLKVNKLLMKGRGIEPFAVYLQEGKQTELQASKAINESSNGGVSNQIFDRELQEDAQRVKFNSSDNGTTNTWKLRAGVHQNWQEYANQNASLIFDIRVLKTDEKQLVYKMFCVDDCHASIDLTDRLTQDDAKNWQRLAIPLSCFVNAGLDMSKVFAPVSFSTKGNWEIELSNIRLAEEGDYWQNIECKDVTGN